MKFRELEANEIECRVAQISTNKDRSPKGLTLLLYKDARVDMKLLDEEVGCMNWKREHMELKGNIYCGISIWDSAKNTWVTKWDCGKESNTESEKGEASDSFKRAGFNWGIGRELYTAPFIWIDANDTEIQPNAKGVMQCKDSFNVTNITYKDRVITGLQIASKKTGSIVFNYGMNTPPKTQKKSEPKKEETKSDDDIAKKFEPLLAELRRTGYGAPAVCKKYNLKKLSDMTDEQIKDCLEKMASLPTKEAS